MADEKVDRHRAGESESSSPSLPLSSATERETELLYVIARLLAREAARDAFDKTCAGDSSEADKP